ncbi:MAG: hypothetical protein EOO20_26290 [Chryseobacterium sp.]|nr:MAG: hypothetical protein EOO20_26290 [Chryseobacterium sp.]
MKKLILLLTLFVQLSTYAQDSVYTVGRFQIKESTLKGKTRTYKITKQTLATAVTPLVLVRVMPLDWTFPKLTSVQGELYQVGQDYFYWDETQLIKIIEEEFRKNSSKLDINKFYKGRFFAFSLHGDPNTLKILNINFSFDSDFIKDFRLIESIDNRIRNEFVMKPKKEWAEFHKLPIFGASYGIKVEKIKL